MMALEHRSSIAKSLGSQCYQISCKMAILSAAVNVFSAANALEKTNIEVGQGAIR